MNQQLPDVLVLCGGQGTRLSSVLPNTPKIMAPINNHIFIDYLFKHLQKQNAKRLILCVGHLRDQIYTHIKNNPQPNFEILFSEETAPLGTGGAIKNALKHITTKSLIVINGDSFINISLQNFLAFHNTHNADISIALNYLPDISRYGAVTINNNNQIIRFKEKSTTPQKGLMNAGVYILNSSLLSKYKAPFSIEKDIFTQTTNYNIYGYVSKNTQFIDIGTPESLLEAQNFFGKL
ncbi:hypothetical protein DID75_03175 [Candidatus Marinamargulisbacteria bacterium SCGC AG-410-N11]|nr:hypothetical protein DID75_03175 [Candidatus Marinamargulisbacteria bacterium SCGC AG-410-N11]